MAARGRVGISAETAAVTASAKAELSVIRIVQRGASVGQRNTFEQDILIKAAEFRRASLIRKRFGQTANLIAFAVVLVAVGKGGEQGDGQDGFLLCGVHLRDNLC